MDRAGRLGPLRGWIAPLADALHALLADGGARYAEWLYLTHTIAYRRLPSYLVALDLRRPDGSFATVDERNAACAAAGMPVAPELRRGTLGTIDVVEAQLGPSRYGDEPAEGVVVRALDGQPPRAAELLRAGFRPLTDDAWRTERPRNQLADREASWH